MNALHEAAKIVEKSWCQGTLRGEDRYCAVGALATTALNTPGWAFDCSFNYFIPEEFLTDTGHVDIDKVQAQHTTGFRTEYSIYRLLNKTPEAKILAEVVMEKRPIFFEKGAHVQVIYTYNDIGGTTREDVVAAMIEAAERLDHA